MSQSSSKIDLLLEQALVDKNAEPAFFRALLEATVYAHVPKHDDSGRLRLIQFVTPEGHTVLPFFTDESQAQMATGNTVKVVAFSGRQLLEATRGATLMLNPNKTPCTLYPEEIAVLLDHGEVAMVESEVMPERQMMISIPEPTPQWLVQPLISLYKTLGCVVDAYLVEVRVPEAPEQTTLLVILAVAALDTERAARATITTIQPLCHGRDVAVDLTAFEPGCPPVWFAEVKMAAFFSQAAAGSAIH